MEGCSSAGRAVSKTLTPEDTEVTEAPVTAPGIVPRQQKIYNRLAGIRDLLRHGSCSGRRVRHRISPVAPHPRPKGISFMRFIRLVPAVLLVMTAASFSQSAASAKPGAGFSIDNIDKSVDPCVDFSP